MSAKKTGALIKSARTNAGLTQEQLAKKIDGLSASMISKAERGEAELTQDQLKAIAKATGVTQKSLLEAASGKSTSKTSSSEKESSGSSDIKLTAAEKKLIELYRAADSDTKKSVLNLLKGEETQTSETSELLSSLIGTVVSQMVKNT